MSVSLENQILISQSIIDSEKKYLSLSTEIKLVTNFNNINYYLCRLRENNYDGKLLFELYLWLNTEQIEQTTEKDNYKLYSITKDVENECITYSGFFNFLIRFGQKINN